jgi:hypothetical protein
VENLDDSWRIKILTKVWQRYSTPIVSSGLAVRSSNCVWIQKVSEGGSPFSQSDDKGLRVFVNQGANTFGAALACFHQSNART